MELRNPGLDLDFSISKAQHGASHREVNDFTALGAACNEEGKQVLGRDIGTWELTMCLVKGAVGQQEPWKAACPPRDPSTKPVQAGCVL